MRRVTAVLLLLLATVVLAACGGDDGGGDEAAPATPSAGAFDADAVIRALDEAGTAQSTSTIRAEGLGLDEDLVVKLTGPTALTRLQMRLKTDLAPVAELLGAPIPTAEVELLVDGDDIHVDLGALGPLAGAFTQGAEAVRVDAGKLIEEAGLPLRGLAVLAPLDVPDQIRFFDAIGFRQNGTERIGGAATTRYTSTAPLKDVVAKLPEADRKAVEELTEALSGGLLEGDDDPLGLDDPQTTSVWIDAEDRIRRFSVTGAFPAEAGTPAGSFSVTTDYSDFGAELDLTPPEGATDVTDTILDLFREGLAAAAGATTS